MWTHANAHISLTTVHVVHHSAVYRCTMADFFTFQFPEMCCDWVNSMLVALLASHLVISFACRNSQVPSPEKSSSGTWGTIQWCPLLAGRDQTRRCDTVWLELDKMHYFGVIYKVRIAVFTILDHEVIKVLSDALSIFEHTKALVKTPWKGTVMSGEKDNDSTWGHIWRALVWRCMMLSGSAYHWDEIRAEPLKHVYKSLACLGPIFELCKSCIATCRSSLCVLESLAVLVMRFRSMRAAVYIIFRNQALLPHGGGRGPGGQHWSLCGRMYGLVLSQGSIPGSMG